MLCVLRVFGFKKFKQLFNGGFMSLVPQKRIAALEAVSPATDLNTLTATAAEINAVCDQSVRGAIERIAAVALTAAELGGSETNTSFTFPAAGAIFLDAWLNVTDAESGTVDVGTQGTSNDPDGILDGVSVAATGYVGQTANVGALRGKFITGSDPVSVTSSGDLNSCEATLYIRYLELAAL